MSHVTSRRVHNPFAANERGRGSGSSAGGLGLGSPSSGFVQKVNYNDYKYQQRHPRKQGICSSTMGIACIVLVIVLSAFAVYPSSSASSSSISINQYEQQNSQFDEFQNKQPIPNKKRTKATAHRVTVDMSVADSNPYKSTTRRSSLKKDSSKALEDDTFEVKETIQDPFLTRKSPILDDQRDRLLPVVGDSKLTPQDVVQDKTYNQPLVEEEKEELRDPFVRKSSTTFNAYQQDWNPKLATGEEGDKQHPYNSTFVKDEKIQDPYGLQNPLRTDVIQQDRLVPEWNPKSPPLEEQDKANMQLLQRGSQGSTFRDSLSENDRIVPAATTSLGVGEENSTSSLLASGSQGSTFSESLSENDRIVPATKTSLGVEEENSTSSLLASGSEGSTLSESLSENDRIMPAETSLGVEEENSTSSLLASGSEGSTFRDSLSENDRIVPVAKTSLGVEEENSTSSLLASGSEGSTLSESLSENDRIVPAAKTSRGGEKSPSSNSNYTQSKNELKSAELIKVDTDRDTSQVISRGGVGRDQDSTDDVVVNKTTTTSIANANSSRFSLLEQTQTKSSSSIRMARETKTSAKLTPSLVENDEQGTASDSFLSGNKKNQGRDSLPINEQMQMKGFDESTNDNAQNMTNDSIETVLEKSRPLSSTVGKGGITTKISDPRFPDIREVQTTTTPAATTATNSTRINKDKEPLLTATKSKLRANTVQKIVGDDDDDNRQDTVKSSTKDTNKVSSPPPSEKKMEGGQSVKTTLKGQTFKGRGDNQTSADKASTNVTLSQKMEKDSSLESALRQRVSQATTTNETTFDESKNGSKPSITTKGKKRQLHNTTLQEQVFSNQTTTATSDTLTVNNKKGANASSPGKNMKKDQGPMKSNQSDLVFQGMVKAKNLTTSNGKNNSQSSLSSNKNMEDNSQNSTAAVDSKSKMTTDMVYSTVPGQQSNTGINKVPDTKSTGANIARKSTTTRNKATAPPNETVSGMGNMGKNNVTTASSRGRQAKDTTFTSATTTGTLKATRSTTGKVNKEVAPAKETSTEVTKTRNVRTANKRSSHGDQVLDEPRAS